MISWLNIEWREKKMFFVNKGVEYCITTVVEFSNWVGHLVQAATIRSQTTCEHFDFVMSHEENDQQWCDSFLLNWRLSPVFLFLMYKLRLVFSFDWLHISFLCYIHFLRFASNTRHAEIQTLAMMTFPLALILAAPTVSEFTKQDTLKTQEII